MAATDYDSMTDEQLMEAAHAVGVDANAPPATAHTDAPQSSGMSTAGKVGLGALATGAGLLAARFPGLRAPLEEMLASKAGTVATEAPLWRQAGLRTAEEAPVARNLAGPSGLEALQQHNREISRTVASNEAGIPTGQEPHLSQDVLTDARREPNGVYDEVASTVPTGQLNDAAKRLVQNAGLPEAGRMTAGSPQAQAQIEALRAQLLDPNRQFTGQQFVNEMRGLRQEGFTNIGSDDVSNQQLGRAQLDMARAVEGHVLDSVPQDLKTRFLAARKTLAKNSTIQQALRGNDVDLQVLARIQRNDPQLLDGGTKMLADFAATHPEVAALPSNASRYNPPSVARDLQDVSLKNPASWIRPALGNLARRSLVGDTDAAVAQANQLFPARDAYSFSPPPAPPRPKFGGYLPAPATVNAGGGASTANTLRDLGLTPDVQAAGLQHPAAARLQALREQLSRPPMEEVPFQGPQKWGEFTLAPQNLPKAAPVGETVPFENVLEQGGTQGKPIAGIQSGYRPAPQSPKGPNMRTPPGAPELTEYTPSVPSDAQMAFRNQQAADRLRKVAGDLRLEGPGGNTGSPLDRLRAALERRERGYAEGGEVRNSSSPGSPGVSGAVKDALAALRDYFITTPQRRLQAQREGIENTVVDDTATHAPVQPQSDYADGGAVPSLAQQEAIEQATRQLADLVSLHEQQSPQAPQAPQMADGGSVDDSQSSVRKIADLARTLNPGTAPETNARVAANLSSLLYGLDKQGNPALGGRAWTTSQGGTPAGVLDALTATPHNVVQLAALVDKYLPGKSNPQFWASIDPQWSKDASQRLGLLKQRMQQAAGVAPAQSLPEEAVDMVTDPSMIAPMGAAKLSKEGTALKKILNWSTGSSNTPPQPATQGP